MRISTVIPVLATVSLLAGCATVPATLPGFQFRPPVSGFNLVDARPGEDKTTERLSLLITSCNFGVTRVGV